MNLESVLKHLEEISFSKRDKGDRFESLIKNWFLSAPLYCDNIEKIWLWNEFPYRGSVRKTRFSNVKKIKKLIEPNKINILYRSAPENAE